LETCHIYKASFQNIKAVVQTPSRVSELVMRIHILTKL
jgi:hypothetical protein